MFLCTTKRPEGDEEQTIEIEYEPGSNMFVFLRALRVLGGDIHWIKYQQRETLH